MADLDRAPGLSRGGALDALRFAAAGFITLYHFGAEEAPRALGDIHPVFERGFLATDFFLILSGYILARAYGSRLSLGQVGAGGFLIRRVARIWPAHLLVLAGFVGVAAAASVAGVALNNPEAFRWDSLARQAIFAHAWGLGSEPGWNSATWTLSALVVCYALFPVVWRGLSRMGPQAALAVGIGGLALADLAARAYGADLYTLPPAVGLGRGLPLFLLGAATARYAMGRPPARTAAWALGLGGGGLLILSQSAPGLSFVSMLALAALILAAGAHAPSRPSRLVAEAAVISFALFITHNLVGLVWFKALALLPLQLSEPAAWAAWGSVFPAALLAAYLFHRWVDAPVQAWLKPRLARRPRLPAGPGARPASVHPA